MAEEQQLTREEQKRRLRENMIQNENPKKHPRKTAAEYKQQIVEYGRAKRRFFLMIAALTAAAVLGFLFYYNNHIYATYSVDWETELNSQKDMEAFPLGDGVIAVSSDSAEFVAQGQIIWTVSVNMTNPKTTICGDYIGIYDRGGQSFIVCDSNGIAGRLTVPYTITNADITEAGVMVVSTQTSEAQYINYYDKSGTRLDVEIKTVLSTTGYPVDFAVSSDGQYLMAVYYGLSGAQGKNRVVFYDFKNGSAEQSYVISTFEDYDSTDTFLADGEFFGNSRAVAVGNNRLSFFTISDRTVTKKDIEISDEIHSVFWGENTLGLVLNSENGFYYSVYRTNAVLQAEHELEQSYDTILFDGGTITVFDSNHFSLYNYSGKLRFSSDFENSILSIAPVTERRFVICSRGLLRQITLK